MRRRTGYLQLRGDIFHVRWKVGGKTHSQTTGKRDRREAEKELRRIMEPFYVGDEITILQNINARIEGRTAELTRLEEERNPPLSLTDAWNAYLASAARPDSGPVTLIHYEGHLSALTKWLTLTHPEIQALRDVTPAIAGAYAQHLSRERRLTANSFNKHVRFLDLLFRVLMEPARLTINPWESIQRKKGIIESRRALTTEELQTVCSKATGEMRLLFAVGLYTGLRLGDAATLRWAEVDLHRRPRPMICRVQNKLARRNPGPVLIPIHPVLVAMLTEARVGTLAEEVLPETADLYRRDPSALTNMIQRHFIRCGIRTIKKDTGRGTGRRAVVEVGFHSLRHTIVTRCREGNASSAAVEALVGHGNPAMTRHYTHISELALADAINVLPDITGESSTLALPPAEPPATIKADILALADQLNGKNWKRVKADLLKLAEAAP